MQDPEILKIATFKLHECEQRMLRLASLAQAPEIRTRLLAVAEQLAREERALAQPAATGQAASAAAPAGSTGATRRGGGNTDRK